MSLESVGTAKRRREAGFGAFLTKDLVARRSRTPYAGVQERRFGVEVCRVGGGHEFTVGVQWRRVSTGENSD